MMNLAFGGLLSWLKVAISIGGVPSVFHVFCRVPRIVKVIIVLDFITIPAALE